MGDWRTEEGNPIGDILSHVIRDQVEKPYVLLMSEKVLGIMLQNPMITDQFGEDATLSSVNAELMKSGVMISIYGDD